MPDEAASPSIHAVVNDAQLLSIDLVHLAASRELEATPEAATDINPVYELATDERGDGHQLQVIFRTLIDVPFGSIRCDVVAAYAFPKISVAAMSPDVFDQFINDVAIMHVLPYTRQAIADITLRVFQNPLLMPVMKLGEVRFEIAQHLKAAAASAQEPTPADN